MTLTQHDYHEAEQQHQEAVEKLHAQQLKLAGMENELTIRRNLLAELQRSVERKRELVNALQAQADLASHKCLEIKVELGRSSSSSLALAAQD